LNQEPTILELLEQSQTLLRNWYMYPDSQSQLTQYLWVTHRVLELLATPGPTNSAEPSTPSKDVKVVEADTQILMILQSLTEAACKSIGQPGSITSKATMDGDGKISSEMTLSIGLLDGSSSNEPAISGRPGVIAHLCTNCGAPLQTSICGYCGQGNA
jgi:hypothetical protein